MNINFIKPAFVALCLAISGFANAGIITLNGSIDDPTEVDHWTLNVTNDGYFTFDVLAREYSSIDFFGNGPGNDLLDTTIYLFENDLSGALLGQNDDGGTGSDGSVSGLDSYLGINLNVGTYVFAIGDFLLTESEARAGYNGNNTSGAGNYRVTVASQEGNISVDSVPEPTTFAMLTLALMGFAARKVRK